VYKAKVKKKEEKREIMTDVTSSTILDDFCAQELEFCSAPNTKHSRPAAMPQIPLRMLSSAAHLN